nr:hypothetical protein CFP56_45010 [Quercus suber]
MPSLKRNQALNLLGLVMGFTIDCQGLKKNLGLEQRIPTKENFPNTFNFQQRIPTKKNFPNTFSNAYPHKLSQHFHRRRISDDPLTGDDSLSVALSGDDPLSGNASAAIQASRSAATGDASATIQASCSAATGDDPSIALSVALSGPPATLRRRSQRRTQLPPATIR